MNDSNDSLDTEQSNSIPDINDLLSRLNRQIIRINYLEMENANLSQALESQEKINNVVCYRDKIDAEIALGTANKTIESLRHHARQLENYVKIDDWHFYHQEKPKASGTYIVLATGKEKIARYYKDGDSWYYEGVCIAQAVTRWCKIPEDNLDGGQEL